jgi:hypothetical protein
MEVHTRDFDGYLESRRKLLTLKPGQKLNWVSYAVACHLIKNHAEAIRVLNECQKTFVEVC